jgi:hypothetical protein
MEDKANIHPFVIENSISNLEASELCHINHIIRQKLDGNFHRSHMTGRTARLTSGVNFAGQVDTLSIASFTKAIALRESVQG